MILSQFKKTILAAALSSLIQGSWGCTKTGITHTAEPVAPDTKPATPPPTALPVAPVRLTPAEEKDLVKIREWSQSQYVFTDSDRDSLRDLGPIPAPGSTKEAYLVMGFVRAVSARPTGPSLEAYAKEYRIPIADALALNPYLKGVEPAKLVIESLQKVIVSEMFFNRVTAALRKQGATWDKGSPPVESIIPPPPGQLAIPFSPGVPIDGPSGGGTTPVIPSLGSSSAPVSDQEILNLGQQLADRGLFVEAILKVQQVGDQSPLKILAIQKIKEYSQNGIQDLRRKARTAFQSANVAMDDRSRVEYLKTARQLLEDAIVLYPDAPQAYTVKENLKAINLQIKQYAPR